MDFIIAVILLVIMLELDDIRGHAKAIRRRLGR